jgi:hypothetical protein
MYRHIASHEPRPTASCRAKQLVILLLHHAVAFTTSRFQARAVEHLDHPAPIVNQPSLLQPPGHLRHAGASHTEHLGEEVVREQKVVAAHPIMRQQQPTGAPLRGQVQSVTHDKLPDLVEHDVRIA